MRHVTADSPCPLSPLIAVDLNRLHDDVKRYSCTPRNHSVNLREELRTTNAVFFPRCLLVKRCGGNCGCGTDRWNSGCVCQASKSTPKLHEVRHRGRLCWLMFAGMRRLTTLSELRNDN